MDKSEWVSFYDMLPGRSDANDEGELWLGEPDGRYRKGLWNWIPPTTKGAAHWWRQNGFTHWMRITEGDPVSSQDNATAK